MKFFVIFVLLASVSAFDRASLSPEMYETGEQLEDGCATPFSSTLFLDEATSDDDLDKAFQAAAKMMAADEDENDEGGDADMLQEQQNDGEEESEEQDLSGLAEEDADEDEENSSSDRAQEDDDEDSDLDAVYPAAEAVVNSSQNVDEDNVDDEEEDDGEEGTDLASAIDSLLLDVPLGDLEEEEGEDSDSEDVHSGIDATEHTLLGEEEMDLEKAEAQLAADNCEAATACRQEQQEHLVQLVQAQEDRRQACEKENVARFEKAKKDFETCEAKAAESCSKYRKACSKKRAAFASEAKDVGIKAHEEPCKPCKPSGCKFVFEEKVCEHKELLATPKVCSVVCDELCPAQMECEKRNAKQIGALKSALDTRNEKILRCQRANAETIQLAVGFVRKCEAQNSKLLARCSQSVAKAYNAALRASKSVAGIPDVDCPIEKCSVPSVSISTCDFPLPPAPKLSACSNLCSSAVCYDRAKCERSNDWLLRRISHYERVFHQCEMQKKTIQLANRDVIAHTCFQKQLMHRVACQMARSKAVLSAHEQVQTCISSTHPDEWATHCAQSNFLKPVPACQPYVCEDHTSSNSTSAPAATSDAKPVKMMLLELDADNVTANASQTVVHAANVAEAAEMDCEKKVAALTPDRRLLKQCDHLCENTMFSKFRGEQAFVSELKDFKNSNLYKDYNLYKEHRSKCINEQCRTIARRTWRRAIISCPPGDAGVNCRRLRRFRGALVRHQAATILRFESKVKKCPAGNEGRTCRRILTSHTRHQMHQCPPNQSRDICRSYIRAREVRILKKCGPDGSLPKCRRARRHCVQRFSSIRAECVPGDEKCRKLSWALVKKECFMNI